MKCKYCHEKISKLDKDVCPFCGGLKPLEGVEDQTQDITKALDQNGDGQLDISDLHAFQARNQAAQEENQLYDPDNNGLQCPLFLLL